MVQVKIYGLEAIAAKRSALSDAIQTARLKPKDFKDLLFFTHKTLFFQAIALIITLFSKLICLKGDRLKLRKN